VVGRDGQDGDDAGRRGETPVLARLRRDLSAAEERLALAEREYHDSGKLMTEVWGQLRAELENARTVKGDDDDATGTPAAQGGSDGDGRDGDREP
jgi:hypothetical protein